MHTTEVGVTVEEGVAAGTAEGECCRTGLLGWVGSERIKSDWIGCSAARCGRK